MLVDIQQEINVKQKHVMMFSQSQMIRLVKII